MGRDANLAVEHGALRTADGKAAPDIRQSRKKQQWREQRERGCYGHATLKES